MEHGKNGRIIQTKTKKANSIKNNQPINSMEAEFKDNEICIYSESSMRNLKQNPKKVIEFAPKQKLSDIIFNMNSSDICRKFQKEKKEVLKRQWIALKNQKKNEFQEDYSKKQKIDDQRHQIAEQVNLKSSVIDKNDQQLHPCTNQSVEEQKRKRSKTQMLIYDYELQKIGTLKLAKNLQKQCYKFHNIQQVRSRNNTKQKILNDQKNNTMSIRLDQSVLINAQSKQKSSLQRVRDATSVHIKTDQVSFLKTKHSTTFHQEKPAAEYQQPQKHCFSRPRNPISKSVMVQKIINLRKTFNDKYKKSPKKSFMQSNTTQYGFNDEKKQSLNQSNSNGVIQYMSFPVMNLKEEKKMTFHELFQHEKKKMELLKKFVNNGDIYSPFISGPDFNKEGDGSLIIEPDAFGIQNLINLSSMSNSKYLYGEEYQNYPPHSYQSRSLPKRKPKWSEVQHQEIQKIKSLNKICPQNFLNINSIPIPDQNEPLQKDLLSNSLQKPKQSSQSHITTYNFDQMHRQLQKPEIKQLRHKYLYSSKRKFTKDDYTQFGVSIVSVNEKEDNNLKRWKKKYNTESMAEECLQIQGKVPTSLGKVEKNSINFVKTNHNPRKHFTSMVREPNYQQAQSKRNHLLNFQPWQNSVSQHHLIEENDFGQFQS